MAAPFSAERLHGVPRRLAAEEIAGRFLVDAIRLHRRQAEGAQHGFERVGEAHARETVMLDQSMSRERLARADGAAKTNDHARHLPF